MHFTWPLGFCWLPQIRTPAAARFRVMAARAPAALPRFARTRKVRITTGDYYPVRYFDNGNTGLLVEDSEIIGTSGDVTSGVAFANYTARRLNIHGMADGLKADSNVLIEDCWIHDLSNGAGEHNDGVQSTGGKGVTIRHNSISGASNACVQTGTRAQRPKT
jgi:hypothetical protein